MNVVMSLIEHIYALFNNFKDEECRAWSGREATWNPNWDQEIDGQWELIVKNSPIPLPDDYGNIGILTINRPEALNELRISALTGLFPK